MNLQRLPIVLILMLAGLLIFSACTPAESSSAVSPEQSAETNEHEEEEHGDEHMDDTLHGHVDPPAEFADLSNPFAGEHESIEAGMETYSTLCASCHGPEGKGDGEAGQALEPVPANLADGTMMGELSDGYLYWRISKGGMMEPFNSAMPGWESSLSETERWQLVSYIRSLSDGDGEGEHHMEEEHAEDEEHMDDDGHHED